MTKITLYISRCLIIMTLAISSLASAQFGSMPGMPPMNGAQGQMPPGGMPMPSEQELEQILQMIEKAAAENPELIKEWERQGQREILKMSDADLASFSQMVGIAPGVLREEAEKALADELGGTPSQQPLDEEFSPQRPPTEKPTQTTAPKISKVEAQQTGALVKSLIKQLTEIQAKAASVREVHELIRAWIQELRELMFYLSVIDRHEYHQHLSLPKFKALLSTLTTLHNALKMEVPAIALPDDLQEESTLYDLLGVKKSASSAVIEAAYERLAAQHNPKKLEQKLRAQGVPEKSIKQQVKKATLSFDAIEDAYEQLSNPKLRTQIDREIQARKGLKQEKIAHATQALKTIRHALEQAVYLEELLYKLEQFLQDYAPQQLALKKSLEDAEKKRLEEQKKQGSITPTSTYGTFEPQVSYKQPSGYDDYGYGSNFNPYSDYGNYSNSSPDYSYGSNDDRDSSGPGSESGTDADADAQKEKDDEKDTDATSKKSKNISVSDYQEAQKIDERPIEEIIKAVDKNFDEFIKNYVGETKPGAPAPAESPYKKMVDDFKITLRTPPSSTTSNEDEEETDEDEEELPAALVAPVIAPINPPIAAPPKMPATATLTAPTPVIPLKKKDTAQAISLPEIDHSLDFEKIRTGLKINALAFDTKNLLEKIEIIDTNESQNKALVKLARKIKNYKNVLPHLLQKIQGLEPDVTSTNNKKTIKAFNALLNDLQEATDNLEEIRDMSPSKHSKDEE